MAEPEKQRNKRLFGQMIGTLQKRKKEEVDTKRAEIDKRIQDKVIKERELLAQQMEEEKREREKKMREEKLELLAEAEREKPAIIQAHEQSIQSFIKTKTHPPIYFLPSQHNEKTRRLLKTKMVF
ncbi:Pinin/SDK/MemA protein [Gorgonomyces haynaldii]|nr:Pinin/SDK/MemA protein [Gorgonomyces haynaldii]